MCIALSLLLFSVISAVATENCTTPNNEIAECVPLYACPQLANGIALDPVGHIEFVRRSKCGENSHDDPHVCCGTAANFTQWQELANRLNVGQPNSEISLLRDNNIITRNEQGRVPLKIISTRVFVYDRKEKNFRNPFV